VPPTKDARGTAVAAGAVVALVVLCAAVAGTWEPTWRPLEMQGLEMSPGGRSAQAVSETAPPPADGQSSLDVPTWLPFIVALLILSVLARILTPVVRKMLATRRGDHQEVDAPFGATEALEAGLPATPALEDGVAAATRLLDDERLPPGDAVIAAWVALEEAAARSGVARQRAQTASEFTVQVLDATQANPASTRRLLDLYLAARFSEHVLRSDDVRAARAALVVLADGVSHLRDTGVDV
jgi:hypothetical protein